MEINDKKYLRVRTPDQSARMVETIFGCKWSLTVYQLLADGINRPGEMVRAVEGLSTKVLNDCLRKNLEFNILEKQIFNETPPRVEYGVTDFGHKFIAVLDEVRKLQAELDGSEGQS
ncbi:helix-turn-helix domain-containing protein [Terasakiella sp. A23]|uniref:winged helix-turn-helix transcriptional regulator n=1 Tax=Terasakiella sp. FCG-A23 TaxID=3080561 RepID=UPI002954447F|nr:helix-turn-helix domain-containing protein [Terasakiella sp. A23]MDV7338216.1 helix-turn-helix domain-containing protein [Terasakiella sp. A23]